MKDREDREALSDGIAGITAEGFVFLLIGLVLGGIGAALALVWAKVWDRSA